MIPLMVQKDYSPKGWRESWLEALRMALVVGHRLFALTWDTPRRALLVAVGLLLGTRMWYAFWDTDKDDDASFDRRVDQVLREVGERGKPTVSESVPPARRSPRVVHPSAAPAPSAAAAPAPSSQASTSARAPAPAPAVEPEEPAREQSSLAAGSAPSSHPLRAVTTSQPSASSAADQTFTPTRSQHPHQMVAASEATQDYGGVGQGSMSGSNLAEVASFLREQQRLQMERDGEAKAERAEMEARLEAQRRETEAACVRETEAKLEASRMREAEAKMEAQRRENEASRVREMEAKLEASHMREAEAKLEAERQVTEAKLLGKMEAQKFREVSVLQVRLEALHSAKLLTDEEMFAMEDVIADSFDDQDHEDEEDDGSRAVACEKVASLVVLSGRIASNASFARQVRRKYVQ